MFAIVILLNWWIFTAEPLPPGAVARFGSARLRTTASVFALSLDGKTIRTIAGGRTIGRWDSNTGRLLGEVLLEGATTNVCWFTPDQRHVAVVDPDGIGLYDAETGKRKRTLIPPDPAGMAIDVFSPDGSTMATTTYKNDGKGSGTGRIHIVPVAGGKSKLIAELPSYVNGLAFSPVGKRLFAAVDNHSLRC